MNFPELPLEPQEPEVFAYCDHCGGEIYFGEGYMIHGGNVYHTECVKEGRYSVAG